MPSRDELFDDDEVEIPAGTAEPSGPSKPFVQFLRETPPAPLSDGTKWMLWGAGVLTGLLFLASLLKMAA